MERPHGGGGVKGLLLLLLLQYGIIQGKNEFNFDIIDIILLFAGSLHGARHDCILARCSENWKTIQIVAKYVQVPQLYCILPK